MKEKQRGTTETLVEFVILWKILQSTMKGTINMKYNEMPEKFFSREASRALTMKVI